MGRSNLSRTSGSGRYFLTILAPRDLETFNQLFRMLFESSGKDAPDHFPISVHGWRKAGCIVIFIGLGLIAAQSARMGFAGLIVELGQKEVDRWTVFSRPQGMREINRVARYFSDSLDYVPDNPWALEGLGALDLARMRLSRIPTQAVGYAWAARLRFRQALQQRPASPFLWANLALAKLYLDEIDAEFSVALRNADELGPWEPTTQGTVLFAGLAAWEKLDSDHRNMLVGVLQRGAVRNSVKMIEIVKSFGRWDLICGRKGYHSLGDADCRDVAGTAQTGAPTK